MLSVCSLSYRILESPLNDRFQLLIFLRSVLCEVRKALKAVYLPCRDKFLRIVG